MGKSVKGGKRRRSRAEQGQKQACVEPLCYHSPTEGGMTCVSTFTSMTASMMVLLCLLDNDPTMALAASWTRLWSGKFSGWKDWI